MDTALIEKFPFILDRNLAKANCTENQVCTSCDIVVLGSYANNWLGQKHGDAAMASGWCPLTWLSGHE